MKFCLLDVAPSPLAGEGWGEGAVYTSSIYAHNCAPLILAFSRKGRRKRTKLIGDSPAGKGEGLGRGEKEM